MIVSFLTLFILSAHAMTAPVNQDSLRRQAGALSAQGRLDSALALVNKTASSLPNAWSGLLRGKLELGGDAARKAFESAVKDSTHGVIPRGEAMFRLGQLHYAAGRNSPAIAQFREYLRRYPKGSWRDETAYWMAHACLQFVLGQPAKKSYLDTGLRYLEKLETRSRPKGYYLPLALAAKGRLLLARGNPGDTSAALIALAEARRRAPPEEVPGALLLTARALPRVNSDSARLWEDSLLWEYPTSLEASFLLPAPPAHKILANKSSPVSPPKDSSTVPKKPRYSLQLGNFSLASNAEEMRKSLAAKGIRVWIEQNVADENRMFRVLHGIFPNSSAARAEGERVFKPMAYPFQVIQLRP